VRFGILGLLEVTDDGRRLRIGGPKLRALLAALLVAANEAVSFDRLAEILWPSSSSDDLLNALQTHVSRLRAIVDPGGEPGERRLASQGSGYLLRVRDDELDALAFETLSRRARAALDARDWRTVVAASGEALGLWRGDALSEFCHEDFARARAAQLNDQRLLTVECGIEAGLALGQHRELVGQLEELVIQHPLRESLWRQLIVALYRSDRQSDALRAYDRIRRKLGEELGISPCLELVHLERAVLNQDSSLEWQRGPADDEDDRGAPSPPWTPTSRTVRMDDHARHNLPRQLTSFVGRGAELAMVVEELDHSRLVTLSGSGGCGKTRLALAVAEAVLPRYPGGAWFVDLAAVSEPELIDRALAEAFGMGTGRTGQLEQVCRRIGQEKLLVVLDNCEHLIEAVALGVEDLLVRCPGVQILATSREELRIGAELVLRVPALSLAADDASGEGVPFLGSEAVQLFIQRGRSALADFAPTGEALDAVAHICRRLDGIPLAIELAAALVASLPVADIAERLDDRFRLLAYGRRLSVERHRTLRATLDWSFELLDEPARDLFVRLAVFVGDFTLAAAETVATTGSDPSAVARGLRHLVATSMVSCAAGSEGADRYRMLETVRQYAQERLDQLDIADEVHWRHGRYYADFAVDAERHVHGPAAQEWLARVASEMPNLRIAVAWAIEHDDVETGLRLAGSLRWYFDRMGLLDETARWLDVWLKRRAELPLDLRLRALTAASNVAFMQGEFSQTRQLGEEGVALARHLDDSHQLALALIVRGSAAVYEGDSDRAEECFQEAEALCARLGDRWGMAWTLTGWAVGSRRTGQLDRAVRQLRDALEIFRSVDDRHGSVLPLVHLALAAQEAGRPYDALSLASEALEIAGEVKDRKLQHTALCVLGRVELSLDHVETARDLLVRSIRSFVGFHHRLMVAIALEGLAGLAGLAGCHGDATALLGFTQRLRERWQIALSSPRTRERAEWLDGARTALGPEQVELELQRGRAMSFDDAFDLAEAATACFAADAAVPSFLAQR
jgi:predicted ATPase/DNA-binding SARP family transcriptional activator